MFHTLLVILCMTGTSVCAKSPVLPWRPQTFIILDKIWISYLSNKDDHLVQNNRKKQYCHLFCIKVKTPHLVQQCCLPRVLQTNQSWNKCFNKLVWSGHRCRRSTYKAFFDEDAPNSVDGLYACDPAKNALLAFFCAFLDSAALEVFDPTFPWNCPSVRTQSCWNLTCQTWEAGLFLCCRCCRRLSDQRPLALDQGLPVG